MTSPGILFNDIGSEYEVRRQTRYGDIILSEKENTHMPYDSARLLQKVSVCFVHSWGEKQKGYQSERYADT